MVIATASPDLEAVQFDAATARLLSWLFGPPRADTILKMRELATELASFPDALVQLRQLDVLLSQLDQAAWDGQRVAVLSVGTAADCPAFETAYFAAEANRQAHRMADLAGLYRAFGVAPAPGAGRPDDLSIELEFLAFMLEKELFAALHRGAPRVAQVRRGLRIFLGQHLGRWLPLFIERLAARAEGTVYHPAGPLLRDLLDRQCGRLGLRDIEPAPGFDPAAWESPRSHGPELGVSSFVPVESLAEVEEP